MPPLLQALDLVKHFPGVRAVDGITFDVPRGSCLGLLGPNGAGKTTTLEMLEGITRPTDGSIRFDGEALGPGFRERIGIQFQTTALQDFQTVRESLHMFAQFYRRSADLQQLSALCRLDEILDRDTRKLSGGQRQRLLLAIALVNDPDLVFLDEPTTGLDPQARRNFWVLIEDIHRAGKTVLLTTHYMEEAHRLCDEIVIMDRGRLIARGSPDALLREHFPAAIVRLPRQAVPDPAVLPGSVALRDNEIEILTDDVDRTLDTLSRRDIPLGDMRVSAPSLEDLFIKLTGHELRG